MNDLLQYEDNLIACYEAEYHLSMQTAGSHASLDGTDYPDSSEVLTTTSTWESGPQTVPMEESAPHLPCSDRTNLGLAPWPGVEGSGRHQIGAAMGNGLSVLSANRADSMELGNEHSSLEPGSLESSRGALRSDENTPPSHVGASLHEYQNKLSLQVGLTPFHRSSSGSDGLISHHDGPQRKRSCVRAPEH